MEVVKYLQFAFKGFDFGRPFSTLTALSPPLRFAYLGSLSFLVSLLLLPLSRNTLLVWAISFSILVAYLTVQWSTVIISRFSYAVNERDEDKILSRIELPHDSCDNPNDICSEEMSGTAPFAPPMSASAVTCRYWLILFVLLCLILSLSPSQLKFDVVPTGENSIYIFPEVPINCLGCSVGVSSSFSNSALPSIKSLSATHHAYELQSIPNSQPFQLEINCWPLPFPMRSDHLILMDGSELKSLRISSKIPYSFIDTVKYIFDLLSRYIVLVIVLIGPRIFSGARNICSAGFSSVRNRYIHKFATPLREQLNLLRQNILSVDLGSVLKYALECVAKLCYKFAVAVLGENLPQGTSVVGDSTKVPARSKAAFLKTELRSPAIKTVARKFDDPAELDDVDDIMTPGAIASPVSTIRSRMYLSKRNPNLKISCQSTRSVGSQSTFCDSDSENADIDSANLSSEVYSPHNPCFDYPESAGHGLPRLAFESARTEWRQRANFAAAKRSMDFGGFVIEDSLKPNASEDSENSACGSSPSSSRESYVNNWLFAPLESFMSQVEPNSESSSEQLSL